MFADTIIASFLSAGAISALYYADRIDQLPIGVIGIAVGLAGAIAMTRLLASYLYSVRPTDPSTFALIMLLQLAIAGLASFIPAHRATKVDPMLALRYE